MRCRSLVGLICCLIFAAITVEAQNGACGGLYTFDTGTHGGHYVYVTFNSRGGKCYANLSYSHLHNKGEEVYLVTPSGGRYLPTKIRMQRIGRRLLFGAKRCYSTLHMGRDGHYSGFVCGAKFKDLCTHGLGYHEDDP